ncbi:probable beta-1,3-galactosyltransferase 14 isoform X1 [Salvia splendens]|uniref:probable beta-1,3-galactosyltransferase 14 isoform X1 n=1 Tax=Salvia splendens TaxID=180675 RepID=UPI001C261336|nr:probable beta-1,3-galactosyltransferase 14 isoform X1 [Salvia splendens]
MPSSPKAFYPRPSSNPRRSTLIIILCLLLGLSTVFGIYAIMQSARSNGCGDVKPLSVSVAWDKSSSANSSPPQKRPKVMGFVGVQTGFGSAGRRRSLRQTWFPSNHQGLRRLEESTGLVFRFIIGRTNDRGRMSALKEEVTKYDDFLLIDIEEEYSKLPYKTLAFFKAAYALYDSDFYVKADDDIYLRPDRLSLLLAKERSHSQTYLGCMKKGPVFTDPKLKWYEPLGHLLGREYFLHAYGPIYALSADVVASLVALRNDSFRMFSNEDVTIGSWMLAMNVNHEDSKLLCQAECTASSIAVWDIPKCSGLCNPEKRMLELHKLETCSKSATLPSEEDEE